MSNHITLKEYICDKCGFKGVHIHGGFKKEETPRPPSCRNCEKEIELRQNLYEIDSSITSIPDQKIMRVLERQENEKKESDDKSKGKGKRNRSEFAPDDLERDLDLLLEEQGRK